MPVTPFHFGPGLLFHSAAPRTINFPAFCLANLITDLEPLYYIVTAQPPVHRSLHTFVGATLVTSLTIVAVRLLRRTPMTQIPNWFDWRGENQQALVIGAALGAFSHVMFDGILYTDVHPFWPLSSINPFRGLVTLPTVYLACFLAGLLGVVWLIGRRWRINSI